MRSLLIADAFLFKCLVEGDDQYLISSFVARSIFEKNRQISTVAYPSVRQYGAINFAVKLIDSGILGVWWGLAVCVFVIRLAAITKLHKPSMW